MRTEKRFTPKLLERFRREGRGTGTFENYLPWHRVGRGDPSSKGRSHLVWWKGRQREFLSDSELDTFHFCVAYLLTLSEGTDLREQFPLALTPNPHELAVYDISYSGRIHRGTLELAELLDIKHPWVYAAEESAPWVMSTDLLLTLNNCRETRLLLAIACKQDEEIQKDRTRQKLAIEQLYWRERGVEWLLITPALCHRRVTDTLRRTASWVLGKQASQQDINLAINIVDENVNRSQSELINLLGLIFDNQDQGQRALWQAIWSAQIPIDLTTDWRPHRSFQRVSREAFITFNPVISRRSAKWC